jgi:uncharacterized membrane protein
MELVLAFNRCLNFISPSLSRLLFGDHKRGSGERVWLWTVPSVVIFFLYVMFSPVTPYNAVGKMFHFDPHFDYVNGTDLVMYEQVEFCSLKLSLR